jgi:hypothetical protein
MRPLAVNNGIRPFSFGAARVCLVNNLKELGVTMHRESIVDDALIRLL